MSLIFISYKSEEREQIRLIAERLQSLGLDVWFDQQIRTGERWDSAIDEQLRGASVVVVCWTNASTQASWVIWEATYGQQNGILAPVFLEDCTAPGPLSFVQGSKLTGWGGEADHPGWISLLSELERLLGRTDLVEIEESRAQTELLQSSEAGHWKRIKDSLHPAEFETFLSHHPAGQFTDAAQSRLEKLTGIQNTYDFYRATPGRVRKVRFFGTLALIFSLALYLVGEATATTASLRNFVFDTYQRLVPKTVDSLPVRIVYIDEPSLDMVAPWPWPRNRIADLVDAIHAQGALAVGIDILFPEPDRFRGENLVKVYDGVPEDSRQSLLELPDLDTRLMNTLAKHGHYVVLARAGVIEVGDGSRRNLSFPVAAQFKGEIPDGLPNFPSVVTNIEMLDSVALGHGLINSNPDFDGIVRRVYLVAQVDGSLTPSFALEMIRVAAAATIELAGGKPVGNEYTLVTSNRALQSVRLADLEVPVRPDGSATIHFTQPLGGRSISASTVLTAPADAGLLKGKIVIVALGATGLMDVTPTPVSRAAPGADVHAQVIESILSQNILVRPNWASLAEPAIAALIALIAIILFPVMPPRWATPAAVVMVIAMTGFGFVMFFAAQILIDVAHPALIVAVTSAMTLTSMFSESTRQH